MVCNSGVSLVPDVHGKLHHFVNSGLYDALFIMEDEETRTLWNHVTGEGLYGKHAGYKLPVSNLMQMSVKQALEMDPDMHIAISDRPYHGGGESPSAAYSPDNDRAELMDMFAETLGQEDARLPRMEMGLGIWSDKSRSYRFYPAGTVRKQGRLVFDEFDGRRILVYVDPATTILQAVYIDSLEAHEARFEGKEIILGDGRRIRAGRVVDPDNHVISIQRPQQIFTRWYGFSLTFPDPEIYE